MAFPRTRLPPPTPVVVPDEELEVLVDEFEAEDRIPDSLNDSPSLATRTRSSSSAVASNRLFAW